MNRRGGVFQLKNDSIYSAEIKKRTAIRSLKCNGEIKRVRHSQTRVTRVDSGKRFRGAEPM